MAGFLSGFSFATATREGNCPGNKNYEPIQLNTLLERFYGETKNKHGKPRKRRFHSIESDSDTD